MPSLYEQALEALDYNLVTVEESYTYYNDIMPVQDVKEGDLLEICVSDGKITARAEKTSAVSWMEQS